MCLILTQLLPLEKTPQTPTSTQYSWDPAVAGRAGPTPRTAAGSRRRSLFHAPLSRGRVRPCSTLYRHRGNLPELPPPRRRRSTQPSHPDTNPTCRRRGCLPTASSSRCCPSALYPPFSNSSAPLPPHRCNPRRCGLEERRPERPRLSLVARPPGTASSSVPHTRAVTWGCTSAIFITTESVFISVSPEYSRVEPEAS